MNFEVWQSTYTEQLSFESAMEMIGGHMTTLTLYLAGTESYNGARHNIHKCCSIFLAYLNTHLLDPPLHLYD